jgi:hypothetical protein
VEVRIVIDTLPKIGNELPNTDEPERVAATLIVRHTTRRLPTLPPTDTIEVRACQLKPVWVVDFYRARPAERNPA